VNVCYGSGADVGPQILDVRFVPEADLRAMSQYCIACERMRSETGSVALKNPLFYEAL
jgi:hypothetical protein